MNFAMNKDAAEDTVEHALELLHRALTILDGENLLVAAAKVDEVRVTLREFALLG